MNGPHAVFKEDFRLLEFICIYSFIAQERNIWFIYIGQFFFWWDGLNVQEELGLGNCAEYVFSGGFLHIYVLFVVASVIA